MTEPHKPLDAALDLFVFAPVGLAITAAEELPKLAAKGRSRVTTQLTMARVVGQFAVSRGRSLIGSRMEQMAAPTSTPAGPAPAGPSRVEETPEASDPGPVAAPVDISYDELIGRETVNGSSRPQLRPVPDAPDSQDLPEAVTESEGGITASVIGDLGRAERAAGPSAAALAIPGYDSLSASQVVQRLAGLSKDELAAVGAYEQANRGRRTILNRVNQLQGQ